MGNVIAIGAKKGGVGKSSTCIHLAGAILSRGKTCVIIDADCGEKDANDTGTRSTMTFCHVRENAYADYPEVQPILCMPADPNTNLRQRIKQLQEMYDYVLVDTPGYMPTMAFKSAAALSSMTLVITELSSLSYSTVPSVVQCLSELEDSLSATSDVDVKINSMLLLSDVNFSKRPNFKRIHKFYAKYLIEHMSFSGQVIKTYNEIQESIESGLTIYDLPRAKSRGIFDMILDEIDGVRSPRWIRGQSPDDYLTNLIEDESVYE